ncbi:MAG: hypothetical protein R3192_07520 [Woeseiaceae bacterium]|nr:hypothetical protein [Woeseiaceae bacterium]
MANTNLPKRFWIITSIMLAWNLIGIAAFLVDFTMSAETLAQMPAEQRALYENVPAWATAAYAIAVICGTLGCLALLFKKSVAIPLFVVSFIAVLLQMSHAFLGSDILDVMGPGSLAMPVVITVVAAFLIWFSVSAKKQSWIG